MRIVAAEARHAARIHQAGHEVVALHSVLVSGAIGKMCESRLAELVLLEHPEVGEIEPMLLHKLIVYRFPGVPPLNDELE